VTSVIAQADRASWQRQAVAELARILEGHPELPCIAWTVGPASSVLIGQVSGLAPAPQVRQASYTVESTVLYYEYYELLG
jgi:hypothetical protein